MIRQAHDSTSSSTANRSPTNLQNLNVQTCQVFKTWQVSFGILFNPHSLIHLIRISHFWKGG
jgi:hypothetical protein